MMNRTEIAAQFGLWNDALQTGNPDYVVALYATDAILLPTVSARVRHNHAEIRDYFEHFLKKTPRGRITEQNIRLFDQIAINSGIYAFTLHDENGESELHARFTFVYQKNENQWQIIEHHSSALPEQN